MTNKNDYLKGLLELRIGDTAFVKCQDFPESKTKVVGLTETSITVHEKGNDGNNWIFSKLDGMAITPPLRYWLSSTK